MSIHFNSPEHIKQRQEVKPLTLEEEENIVANLNIFFSDMPMMREKMQQLLFNYEKYKHAYISSRNITSDIEVKYDIVEPKNNKNE